jgi:hypothetical protein
MLLETGLPFSIDPKSEAMATDVDDLPGFDSASPLKEPSSTEYDLLNAYAQTRDCSLGWEDMITLEVCQLISGMAVNLPNIMPRPKAQPSAFTLTFSRALRRKRASSFGSYSPVTIKHTSSRISRRGTSTVSSSFYTAGWFNVSYFQHVLSDANFRHLETPNLHTKADWLSVLCLFDLLEIESFRTFAIKQLTSLTTPADKIIFGRLFHIGEWLEDAYQTVCKSPDWLSNEDCQRLGLEEVVNIAQAREKIRSPTELQSSVLARACIVGEICRPW